MVGFDGGPGTRTVLAGPLDGAAEGDAGRRMQQLVDRHIQPPA